jgi:uroporphyrinogen decarboxylase
VSARYTLFSRAAHREPVERTPVWFMRQAGRILPEYRAIRERWSLLEICQRPEVCTEVTLQPINRLDVDAAILFCDIMVPLLGVGIDLDIVEGVGPVIQSPIRAAEDVTAIRDLVPEADLPYVLETIKLLKCELGDRLPLIGFAGAPFTLASYLIEGRPSREFVETKSMMYRAPHIWHALMDRLTNIVITFLKAQVASGADALQLFDSWVGCLSPQDYVTFVQPYTKRIFAALAPSNLPLIHFGTNTATLLDHMKADGASIIGVDWRIPLDEAWRRIGPQHGIQGNLDPVVLFAPPATIKQRISEVLSKAGNRPGHIFNLGHGLHPNTPLDNVIRAVEYVRELSSARAATHPAEAFL